MIRIEKIEIVDFRGIRNLTLTLDKKSFGIAGPNGTGKSGVVDAIEFALTGNITRLGGAGTGELSVKAHGPHLDSSKRPEKSAVKITAHAPSLGKGITIERTVKGASTPSVTPNDAKTRAFLAQLETHPEFALSRREIIKYILTPAGERSKDVQILLRLEQIEKVRTSLQRVANDAKRDSAKAEVDDNRAKQEFFQHLGHKAPKKGDLLAAVNERRALLKLAPLTDLTSETSIKEDVIADESKGPAKDRLSKGISLSELTSYHEYVAEHQNTALRKSKEDALAALTKLTSDPSLLKSFRQKVLLEQGLELIDDEACPLCDTAWDINKLKAHLQAKMAKAAAATAVLGELTKAVQPIADNLDNLALAARKIVQACGKAEPKLDAAPMLEFIAACEQKRAAIAKACVNPDGIADAIEALAQVGKALQNSVTAVAADLKDYVDALPEPSKEEVAREFLIVAQEKYDRCRTTKGEVEAAVERANLASKVFDQYGKVSTSVLESIYDTVQKDFTSYYSFINRDDEEKFEGKLTPSVGKLAFDVDFYGRGKFPPGAYHSEGHQDAMGLCLYLALMKHMLGDGFTLAVLDDVLMSVDVGHRREVCSLLKAKFPKTQFILTTHDPVWLQFMRTENLIQGSINFGGWTVDSGPQVWSEGDVWKQIADKLTKSDVSGAAATLRRYLEYISTILAHNLRARVEYHGDGHYDLGDLWPAVIQAWKARLQEAKDSAASWGKGVVEIEARQAEAKKLILATSSEQWMINKTVHYNAWANLQSKEFEAVAAAFQDLLKSMQCSIATCSEFLCVSPVKGEKQALRCGCGNTNLNLKVK
jgi:RecF/RecN/SMC family protein